MSAILLLGNVRFAPRVGDDAFDVEIIGKDELHSVAKLLGVSATLLCQGLTRRTHAVRGQTINSSTDSHQVIVIINFRISKPGPNFSPSTLGSLINVHAHFIYF